jgi:hypothetical protein
MEQHCDLLRFRYMMQLFATSARYGKNSYKLRLYKSILFLDFRTSTEAASGLVPSSDVWEEGGGYLGVALGVLVTVVLLLIIIILFILYKNIHQARLNTRELNVDSKQVNYCHAKNENKVI